MRIARAALLLTLFVALIAASATSAIPSSSDTGDIIGDLRWRNIGPANMMGRIASIDALDADHRVVLVGSASGGVFLSANAGTAWKPIFDNAGGAGSIGAAVLFQADPKVIWVGTGEAANRNSSGWGDGVWRTTDGGDTWTHRGLESTHHIAEIATHPTDPDIAYVASPGHLWGYSGDRGLFRTRDGGSTWDKLTTGLPDDGKTGCTEIIMDPSDPDVLYAGFYHRLRQPATMQSGGGHGGIFKSTDGGDTWKKLTGGLPEVTGMIDIAIHRADPRVVVAAVEADENIAYDESKHASENPPGGGLYMSHDAGATWTYLLRTHVRPFYHGQVDVDPLDPARIYSVGREFEVSKDGGETWVDRWWGGGGDDHDLWIAADDGRIRYMATDQGAYLTVDDGETVVGFENMAIGQYYKVGVDMQDPYWVIGGLQDNGIWMGPSNSRERRGILNTHNTWVAEGDGFASLVDPLDARIVYTVNHVGFVARQDIVTREHEFITPTPETTVNFAEYVDLDSSEERIRYTIDPGEHWFFRERPERPLLPPQFRFNWNSPLVMSPSNTRVLYFAGNHVFKSIDRGDSWRIISPDLTANDPAMRNPSNQGGLTRSVTGGENHFTVFTIAESPLDPAVVWAGTDDGFVWVTRDGGSTWNRVSDAIPALPDDIWVSRVEASRHAPGRAYVAFDNHRHDDMTAYVFRTDDFGVTWTDVSGDLPDGGATYVIVEDPVAADLLVVGTEFGVWTSIDGGSAWHRLDNGLPTVAAYDLLIHPREGDLVVGTHGRSIWILDDISPLRQLAVRGTAADLLMAPRRATRWSQIDLGRKQPFFLFRGENPPPGALLNFWLADAPQGAVTLRVEEVFGDRVADVRVAPHAGTNRAVWPLMFPTTLGERGAFRSRMGAVIDDLEGRVTRPELREQLTQLRIRLAGIDLGHAQVDRDLNAVRSALVRDYAAWAAGKELFGPRLAPAPAAAGRYRVVLEVAGQRHETHLDVREDPLRRD